MNYTVSDFYLTFASGLKIIAGRGGMTRSISRAGILDYEMDLVLKDKYMHSNFQENQLVISTFLYAKDNPFLIADAVKHLIAKGTSGLVIKNVFGLPIHDTVLRYADSKNFPIFLVESQDVYIEDLIYAVNRHRELLADIRFAQKKLEQILFGDLTEKEIPACAKQINPSYRQQFFTLYIKMDDLLSNAAFDTFSKRFVDSPLNEPGNSLIFFRQGFFYIHSEDRISQRCTDDFIAQILNILLEEDAYVSCGLSQCHLTLEEFRISLQESLYAASAEKDAGAAFTRYNQLGTYQLLFPFAASREMQLYARNILEPIKDYDIENNARLLPTLQQFIQTGCLLEETARRLSQHKNTVRYRLDKIHELTGLDYKIFSHLEQLSMAVKIDQCGGQTY